MIYTIALSVQNGSLHSPKTITSNVREHDHITEKCWDTLCRKCNSRLVLKRNILLVVFNNFKNYDAHLIFKYRIDKFMYWLPVTDKFIEDIPSLRTGALRRKSVFPYTYTLF